MARVEEKSGAKIAIIMGSDSDLPVMQGAASALDELQVDYVMKIVSAHRTPELMAEFARSAVDAGYGAIIAGAGGAAHLPGMVAAHTPVPVIGVPVPNGAMNGQDALYSIVQMPKGVPVATVAIGGAFNAGLLAAQILAFGGTRDEALVERLSEYKRNLRDMVLQKTI